MALARIGEGSFTFAGADALATERVVAVPASPAPESKGAGHAYLVGSVATPRRPSWIARALILSGSGPTDRDGNQPGGRSDCLRLLAHGLARAGIASARFDKRGVGASRMAAPTEATLRLGAYVDDTCRWLAMVRQMPGNGPCLLIGHSEGALVAILAAQRVRPDGLVLLACPGFPLRQVIERQTRSLPAPLREALARGLLALERGGTPPRIPPALTRLLRPSVQPYLRSLLPVDPARELQRSRVPTLVVQGTHDLQVELADARRLARARAGIDLAIIPRMNHVLKPASSDRKRNLASYWNEEAPLAPGLLEAITGFVAKRLGTSTIRPLAGRAAAA